MGSKQSVQFLASQLMGLGDRFRQEAQSEKSNALAKRYASIAEGKMAQEVKQAKRNQAQFELGELSKLNAIKALVAKGIKPTEETITAELPAASKATFLSFSPEKRALFGPDYEAQFKTQPVDIGFGRSIPQKPLHVEDGGMGLPRPGGKASFAERERAKLLNQPMNEFQRKLSGPRY